jgi:hypothetical protein
MIYFRLVATPNLLAPAKGSRGTLNTKREFDELKRQVEAGSRQLDSGHSSAFDDEAVERIKKRGRALLAGAQRSGTALTGALVVSAHSKMRGGVCRFSILKYKCGQSPRN